MNACFHIIGCVAAAQPATEQIAECLGWARRLQAEVLGHNDREAVFVQFDAADAQLVLGGCRAALARRPLLLRFGFASGIKEAGADGKPRAGERGIAQACDLAGAAQPGEVLLSSQLGSLLQIAHVAPADRIHARRVPLLDGRTASAYSVELRWQALARDPLPN